ncbi:MAG TPA: serine hydrolase domain-containing protein [Ignavibacteriaceae bacterium]|nr:serine hydrolase domain-containing protein [Ignavibacteriaceae bacterium]
MKIKIQSSSYIYILPKNLIIKIFLGTYFKIVCLLVLLTIPLTAQLRPKPQFRFEDNSAQLSSYLDSRGNSQKPGFAFVVFRGDKVLLEKCYGIASMDSRKPITENTMFYSASIGKTFTSAAILKLKEVGKLKLWDKLSKYFQNLPSCTKDIRIFNLLNHTSGLPDHYDFMGENVKSLTNDDVVEFAENIDSLLFEPGTDYLYSNTAYVLLAKIIEKVSEQSYADFLRKTFFNPLGMSSTVVYDNTKPEIKNRAIGYNNEDGIFVENDYRGITTTGAGGIYINLIDMKKWLLALRSNKVLKPRELELVLKPPFTLSGQKSYMAMGWFDETFGSKTPEVEGITSYAAIGVLRGFRAVLQFMPDYDLSYILLCNTNNFPVRGSKIAAVYLKKND